GMTANISITVDRRERVLKIPNAALRYTPAGAAPQRVEAVESNPIEDNPQTATRQAAPPIMAPGQKWDPANKVSLDRPKQEVLRRGRVWVLNSQGQPEARTLLLGITDGSSTEVVSGPLQAGDQVVVGDTSQVADQKPRQNVSNPLLPMPRVPGGGRGR